MKACKIEINHQTTHADVISLCRKWGPFCEIMILEFNYYRQFASQTQAMRSHTIGLDAFNYVSDSDDYTDWESEFEEPEAYLRHIVLVIGWDAYSETIENRKPLFTNTNTPRRFNGRTHMSTYITFDDEFDSDTEESEEESSENVFDLDPIFLSDFCRLKDL